MEKKVHFGTERCHKFQLCPKILHTNLTSLAPLLGEIETWVHSVFCKKFNLRQLLFEAFFDTIGTSASVLPHQKFFTQI